MSNQMMFPNMKIIPLTFVLKYNPAVIGVIYRLHENDPKKRLYKIYLHGLINKNNSQEITQQLFEEHKIYLNKKYVSFDQIEKLVQKLLEVSRENKKSQKLFADENPSDKYLKKATDKDKIFVKDDTADLLQMNLMKRKDANGGSKALQQNSNQGVMGYQDGKQVYNGEDDEFDDDMNRNIEEGLEDLDPDTLEYDIENGDDLLDEEEYIAKMQVINTQEKVGGSNKANFLKGLGEKDFFGNKNLHRGNLSD